MVVNEPLKKGQAFTFWVKSWHWGRGAPFDFHVMMFFSHENFQTSEFIHSPKLRPESHRGWIVVADEVPMICSLRQKVA